MPTRVASPPQSPTRRASNDATSRLDSALKLGGPSGYSSAWWAIFKPVFESWFDSMSREKKEVEVSFTLLQAIDIAATGHIAEAGHTALRKRWTSLFELAKEECELPSDTVLVSLASSGTPEAPLRPESDEDDSVEESDTQASENSLTRRRPRRTRRRTAKAAENFEAEDLAKKKEESRFDPDLHKRWAKKCTRCRERQLDCYSVISRSDQKSTSRRCTRCSSSHHKCENGVLLPINTAIDTVVVTAKPKPATAIVPPTVPPGTVSESNFKHARKRSGGSVSVDTPRPSKLARTSASAISTASSSSPRGLKSDDADVSSTFFTTNPVLYRLDCLERLIQRQHEEILLHIDEIRILQIKAKHSQD